MVIPSCNLGSQQAYQSKVLNANADGALKIILHLLCTTYHFLFSHRKTRHKVGYNTTINITNFSTSNHIKCVRITRGNTI